jgi:hypothetical protein
MYKGTLESFDIGIHSSETYDVTERLCMEKLMNDIMDSQQAFFSTNRLTGYGFQMVMSWCTAGTKMVEYYVLRFEYDVAGRGTSDLNQLADVDPVVMIEALKDLHSFHQLRSLNQLKPLHQLEGPGLSSSLAHCRGCYFHVHRDTPSCKKMNEEGGQAWR